MWAKTSVCDVDVDESPKMATNRLELEAARDAPGPATPHRIRLASKDLVLIAFQTGSLDHLQKGIGIWTPKKLKQHYPRLTLLIFCLNKGKRIFLNRKRCNLPFTDVSDKKKYCPYVMCDIKTKND